LEGSGAGKTKLPDIHRKPFSNIENSFFPKGDTKGGVPSIVMGPKTDKD
jgi:hypothetical protein